MKIKLLNEGPERTYAVVLDSGDEVNDCLSRFAAAHGIQAARVSAIGAFSSAVLGFFERDRKDYRKIVVSEQVEVLSLLGDIALFNEKSKLHLHVVLGKPDGSAIGGHLLEGRVWPTLEVMIVEPPGYLCRRYDEELKLPLIDLDK